jgi:hypothetical protein
MIDDPIPGVKNIDWNVDEVGLGAKIGTTFSDRVVPGLKYCAGAQYHCENTVA